MPLTWYVRASPHGIEPALQRPGTPLYLCSLTQTVTKEGLVSCLTPPGLPPGPGCRSRTDSAIGDLEAVQQPAVAAHKTVGLLLHHDCATLRCSDRMSRSAVARQNGGTTSESMTLGQLMTRLQRRRRARGGPRDACNGASLRNSSWARAR